jgi:hypothetical protein
MAVPSSPDAQGQPMIEVTVKPASSSETDERRQKKQSIFPSGAQPKKKEGGGREMPASLSTIRVSQTVRPKAAIITRADWSMTMKRAERKEAERNKDLPNASFYFRANSQLSELFSRARKGDIDAAKMLLGCLSHNVGELEKFCSSKSRIAKRIVVIGEPWPLLHTGLKPKDGALTISPDHFLRKLGVVRGTRRYNIESKGTKIAITLYEQMEFYRHTVRQTFWDESEKHLEKIYDHIRKLKPLSPSNYSVWWKAAEPLFLWQWGDEFQDHRDFKRWNDAAYKGKLGEMPHSPRGRKRRDIKRAVKQGFMSLANSLRKRGVC